MGTFHDTSDPLHGITVVARVKNAVHVGLCHERDDRITLLVGVDSHEENADGVGEDGRTNAQFLDRAAKLGVWGKQERVALETSAIESLIPLNQYYSGPGATPAEPAPEVAPAPSNSRPGNGGQPTELTTTAPAASGNGDKPVTLTDSACAEVRRLLDSDENRHKGLRLGVAGGGCSGLVYKVEFDSQTEGDLVVPFEGFDVLLDRKSTIYLRGVTLDFQAGLSGRGFQFKNPNASNTCGCGESFAV